MRHSKISLLGFMGAGKTSVAPLLAERLGLHALDLDSILLARSGFRSIPEMFRTVGEPAFRDLEAEVAQSLANSTNVVISTGGGVIGRAENMASLKANGGICILLHAPFAELMRRIPNIHDRPLLQDPSRAEALYNERQQIYRSYADIVIDTTGKIAEEVCSEIVMQIG
jgi:shikimate kinase